MNAANRLSRFFVMMLVVFLLHKNALAQGSKLVFEPSPLMPPLIDDRPAVTDWLATVTGGSLMEGRMELTLSTNGQALGHVVTDEIVLSGIEQKIRIGLPPLKWRSIAQEIDVKLVWRGKDGERVLPSQRLRLSRPQARKFSVLIGETPQRPRATRSRDKLADRLRFESLLSEELHDYAVTIHQHQTAPELPQDALAYCQFDLLAIADDVFPALRSSQLEAIAAWVRAGGSLYLEPRGILEASHLKLLNRLVQELPDRSTFVTDEKGHLPRELLGEQGVVTGRCGLGVFAISLMAEDEDLGETDWRKLTSILWRIQPKFTEEPGQDRISQRTLATRLKPIQDQEINAWVVSQPVVQMMDLLRPQGVKLVPLWVIGSMLTLLVLLIGPVDYVLLGTLRRRKWTWVTFPLCVVVITGITIALTNTYLSSSEARRTMTLHDVAADGEIVRTNRFELVFASASRMLTTDVQAALFTPLRKGGSAIEHQYRPQPYGYGGYGYQDQMQRQSVIYSPSVIEQWDTGSTDPVNILGRVPGRYKVAQRVEQWTPQINRLLTIAPQSSSLMTGWKLPRFDDGRVDESRLAVEVQARFGEQARFSRIGDQSVSTHATIDHRWSTVMQGLTITDRFDIGRIVHATSPHGGRSLDDLGLTVPHAAADSYLLVFVTEGEDLVVYRRLITAAD